jgi:hypothetical protein
MQDSIQWHQRDDERGVRRKQRAAKQKRETENTEAHTRGKRKD